MNKRTGSCLLIWPPLVTVSNLPLGIPSLTAYLKKKGMRDVEVLDLNTAYLKKMRFFWILYLLNRQYWRFVYNFTRGLKAMRSTGQDDRKQNARIADGEFCGVKTKKRSLWKRLLSAAPQYVNKWMNERMDRLAEREKNAIPWSLQTLVNFDLNRNNRGYSNRVSSILDAHVKKADFSLVGISVIYPEQLLFSFMIAREMKEKFGNDIRVAIGGTQITKHASYIINSEKLCRFVDFFITDDGEEPLKRLLEEAPRNKLFDIPNLYFKNSDGERRYERSQDSFQMHPKDFLTPDFTGFDLNVYRNQMPLLTSKGCFWSKCNFCTYTTIQQNRYCIGAVEKVLGFIKEIKERYGSVRFRFVDEALTPKFMEELAEGLSKDKFNIDWSTNIILSREFANQGFCKVLKNSGLSQVAIGLESMSPRVLRLMNKYHKDINESEIKEILASLKHSGIRVAVHIMFGFPTETFDEARKTLNFLVDNRDLYEMCMFQTFCLEDNTPIFYNPQRFGITKIHTEDKSAGERLGYCYEVAEGMSQDEAVEFTYGEAVKAFKDAHINAKSSEVKLYQSNR